MNLESVEKYLKEAREIAERAGYRLALADIHLFCAEVLLDLVGARRAVPLRSQISGVSKTPEVELLGLPIPEHLQKAKDYALDISEFKDLYQSQDPHFYDGIPEAAMLKRGMTQQERIDNGYTGWRTKSPRRWRRDTSSCAAKRNDPVSGHFERSAAESIPKRRDDEE